MAVKGESKIRCSFCGKSEDQVKKLIAGPDGAYICDECIEICAEIMDEELEQDEAEGYDGINLLKPQEMKEILDDYVIGQEQAKKYFRSPYIITTRECWRTAVQISNCRKAIS